MKLDEAASRQPLHVSRPGDRDSFLKPVALGTQSGPISPSPTVGSGETHSGKRFGKASRRRSWKG